VGPTDYLIKEYIENDLPTIISYFCFSQLHILSFSLKDD